MAGINVYEKIVYQINNLIKQEDIYPTYMDSISAGKNDYKLSQVYTKRNYDSEWIKTIEDCIVSLDNIVRNPRKFIVIEEDIVDISLARSISVESVKHLSQHTNLIASVDKNGTVIPSKILNTSKEESFDIYENRFIYTLLLKLRDFIDRRFLVMQGALLQSGELDVALESEFAIDKNKVKYKMESSANFPFDEVVKRKGTNQLSDMERVVYIKSIISDFLASPFAKEMRSCALVRPPIQRTNVILKNPDFKKALVLWQFVETAEKMDFTIDTVTETAEMPPALADKYRGLVFLNTVLMQSIAATKAEGDFAGDKEGGGTKLVEADDYRTKNIDDFVPDDFPHLKMELSEIRRIYRKLTAGEATLTLGEIGKMNGALDRVIRQFKINKAKEDGIRQQKLIAKQLEEEAIAKRLALREQKDLERKARMEEARRRIQLRKEEEEHKLRMRKLEAAAKKEEKLREKQAREELLRQEQEAREELARIQKEKEELDTRRREEANRIIELRRIQDERVASERQITRQKEIESQNLHEKYEQKQAVALSNLEKAKELYNEAMEVFRVEQENMESELREHIAYVANKESERVAREEEAKMLVRLAETQENDTARINEKKTATLEKMKAEASEYWAEQQELATALGINLKLGVLREFENERTKQIILTHEQAEEALKKLYAGFEVRNTAEELIAIDALIALASKRMDEKTLLELTEDIDKKIRDRNRLRKKLRRQERRAARKNGKSSKK